MIEFKCSYNSTYTLTVTPIDNLVYYLGGITLNIPVLYDLSSDGVDCNDAFVWIKLITPYDFLTVDSQN